MGAKKGEKKNEGAREIIHHKKVNAEKGCEV